MPSPFLSESRKDVWRRSATTRSIVRWFVTRLIGCRLKSAPSFVRFGFYVRGMHSITDSSSQRGKGPCTYVICKNFWQPPVWNFTQPRLLSFLTASDFGVPHPLHELTSYVHASQANDDRLIDTHACPEWTGGGPNS